MNGDELTSSEKKALESLPKERMPSAFLEERVVRTLRKRGLLQHSGRRLIEVTGLRLAGVVAACLAFVLCGFTLGFWASAQRFVPTNMNGMGNGIPAAISVQQAGTAYIVALESLAQASQTAPEDEIQQGREVALNTLYTAADQMVKIVPKDVLAKCIVHAIETTEGDVPGRESEQGLPRVIQF